MKDRNAAKGRKKKAKPGGKAPVKRKRTKSNETEAHARNRITQQEAYCGLDLASVLWRKIAVEAPPEIQEMLRAYNRMRYICTDVLEPFPDMFHWDHAAYLRAWHDVTRLLAGEKAIGEGETT